MPEETYNIYDLLDKMREKPAMYMGEKSLVRLQAHIYGYSYAMDNRGIKDVAQPPLGGIEFHDWVAVKLGYTYSEMGWCNLILSEALGWTPKTRRKWERLRVRGVKPAEDAAAFDRFYELLDQYRCKAEEQKGTIAL